jgi:putative ABC transport system ATP-binding protein
MLELRDLVKCYQVGEDEFVRAVDGVSLTVGYGELVALYGPSGSGKTTLLMLIAGLLSPDRGAVLVDGRDISTLNDSERSHYRLRELGFVDQTSDLLPGGSVVQNAAMKLWLLEHAREAEHRIEPLLVRLGLGKRLRQRADQLSMGERQRVMIARALSTEPKLVLADEPTGNLDSRRSREVLGLLAEVCRERGTAVLLVTHDPLAMTVADRVYALQDGSIVDYEPDRFFALAGTRPGVCTPEPTIAPQ